MHRDTELPGQVLTLWESHIALVCVSCVCAAQGGGDRSWRGKIKKLRENASSVGPLQWLSMRLSVQASWAEENFCLVQQHKELLLQWCRQVALCQAQGGSGRPDTMLAINAPMSASRHKVSVTVFGSVAKTSQHL